MPRKRHETEPTSDSEVEQEEQRESKRKQDSKTKNRKTSSSQSQQEEDSESSDSDSSSSDSSNSSSSSSSSSNSSEHSHKKKKVVEAAESGELTESDDESNKQKVKSSVASVHDKKKRLSSTHTEEEDTKETSRDHDRGSSIELEPEPEWRRERKWSTDEEKSKQDREKSQENLRTSEVHVVGRENGNKSSADSRKGDNRQRRSHDDSYKRDRGDRRDDNDSRRNRGRDRDISGRYERDRRRDEQSVGRYDRDRERDDRRERNYSRRDDRGYDRRQDEGRRDDGRGDRGRNDRSEPDRRRNEEKDGSRNDSKRDESQEENSKDKKEETVARPSKKDDQNIMTRTGGAYIPPARLRMMQAQITDKTSAVYQRMAWEALKKSINGLINKVNISNIKFIVSELFQENIVRGRGVLSRSIIQAQAASPTFTHVYAALVAILNTKFPQNGELILKRLIIQFRRGFKRNDKNLCLSSTRFLAHLVNQQVAHEVLALEILTLLLDSPTDDSVEIGVGFLKECGQKLVELSPRGVTAIFDRLRNVLHEGQIDKRVQYMTEVMFAVRKDSFKDFPSVVEGLDLVEDEEQFTHLLSLEQAGDPEDILNVFKEDENYLENEEKYKTLKKGILGESSSDDGSADESGSSSSDSSSDNEEAEAKQTIIDTTETNMVVLRRTIYLTIQSSLDYEECAYKLLKMDLKPGQEVELCNMILDCCCQLRTYEKFFGLLAQRFCQMDRKYVEPFQMIFKEQYETIHRLETSKLRNVAKFFAHLLYTDAINWGVMCCISLTEDDTTSASRIFIKLMFQELSEYMGLPKLNDRLKDPTLQAYFEGIMPRDNPKHTRFAINFFTTIGLGGLTEELRNHLKDVTKQLMEKKAAAEAEAEKEESDSSGSSSDSSSDSSSSSSSSSGSESDSESSSSESDDTRKKKLTKKKAIEKPAKKRPDSKKKNHHHKEKSLVETYTDPWERQTNRSKNQKRNTEIDSSEEINVRRTNKHRRQHEEEEESVTERNGRKKRNKEDGNNDRASEGSRKHKKKDKDIQCVEEEEKVRERYSSGQRDHRDTCKYDSDVYDDRETEQRSKVDRYVSDDRADDRYMDRSSRNRRDKQMEEDEYRRMERNGNENRNRNHHNQKVDRHAERNSNRDNVYEHETRHDSSSEDEENYRSQKRDTEKVQNYDRRRQNSEDNSKRRHSHSIQDIDIDRHGDGNYKRVKREVDDYDRYEDSSVYHKKSDRDRYNHNKENMDNSPRKRRYNSSDEEEETVNCKYAKNSHYEEDYRVQAQKSSERRRR